MKLLSYNLAQTQAAWCDAAELDVDVALLQEVCRPPSDVHAEFAPDVVPWKNEPGPNEVWKCAVARMSDRVRLTWHAPHIAEVQYEGDAPIIVVSLYARWRSPHPSVGSSWIYADASAHERISELSAFIGSQSGHRIIAAGDLNILYGHGEDGSTYWRDRYATVFQRCEALGLRFCGPQYPRGRRAEPWPAELPPTSANVPTFRPGKKAPIHAKRQLDFVFASASIADRVTTTALNEVDSWGASDHCRVLIEVD